jgi:lysine-N-methylase
MFEHLRPQYAKQFHCIGSECEDTCCHGFDVPIDRATYEKYQSLPGFQPHMDQHLVLITSNPTDSEHARIKLTPSFTCPFLAADRLCSIQKEHGEDYLSMACASYPRVTRRVDGLIEKALLLSCPEAARLVLLNPNLMQPDPSVAGDRSPYYRFFRMGDQPAKTNGSPHQYLWEIRSLSLLLIQDRAYPLWQRLFILGMFCKRLKEITAAQQIELVPRLLKDYAEIVVQGRLRSSMDGIPAQTTLQLGVVMEVLHRQLDLELTDASHVRFRECVQDFLRGIRFNPASPIEICTPFYAEAHARYYQPFMQESPFILENYLINHVFRTRFPFGVSPQGEPNDPLAEYLMMCIQYAVIKGLLIGMAGHYQEVFAAAHVVKLVQSFSKAVEHCPKFVGASNLGLADANGMAILLKT